MFICSYVHPPNNFKAKLSFLSAIFTKLWTFVVSVMTENIDELLELQRKLILADRQRLSFGENECENSGCKHENCDNHDNNNELQSAALEDKENLHQEPLKCPNNIPSPAEKNNLPLIERLDLDCNEGSLEESKQAFINKIVNCQNPLSVRSVQYELRRQVTPEKDVSPHFMSSVMHSNRNIPSYRVDQRLTSAQNALLKPDMDKPKSILSNRRTGSPRERLMSDLTHSYTPSFMDGFSYQDRSEELERERIKRDSYQHELRLQIEEKRRLQNLRDEQERREQELENRRLEQQLLRMQEEQMIEEQRRSRRDEQMRRHSEDLLRRKHDLQARQGFRKHTDSESSVSSLRNTNVASEALSHYSPPISRRNPYSFNIPSTSVFADPPSTNRYSPGRYDPHYRKDTLNRMDLLNTYDTHSRTNAFSRYDSLNRIDSLSRQDTLNRIESLNIQDSLSNVQRRHSATQQDLSLLRKSPKLQRRSSSSRFEDSLPIPVLKAHSPVAKELKNSIPFSSSRHSSDAVRKLEDKWQIPAVQRNIVNHGDSLRDGQSRSILTQLGAIRMQLQQEQLRMDETLRKRDITQSKAVDFHYK